VKSRNAFLNSEDGVEGHLGTDNSIESSPCFERRGIVEAARWLLSTQNRKLDTPKAIPFSANPIRRGGKKEESV